MDRETKIRLESHKQYPYAIMHIREAFIEGAKWADRNPQKMSPRDALRKGLIDTIIYVAIIFLAVKIFG